MAVNKVMLVGNVGKDPEVRRLDNGTPVCNFPLATNEVYTNRNGERVKNTEWHNLVLWRKLAEIAEKYVKKGDLLYIEGKIRTRSYDDRDGNKRYMTEIVADNMQMLGKRQDSDQGGGSGSQSQSAASNAAPSNDRVSDNNQNDDDAFSSQEDDLPF